MSQPVLTEGEKQIKAAWDARDCIRLCELAEHFRRQRNSLRTAFDDDLYEAVGVIEELVSCIKASGAHFRKADELVAKHRRHEEKKDG